MRTAIVYDRVNKWGGAERILLALHEIFPDAPLYTSVYSPHKATWAGVFPSVKTSFLNRIHFLRDKHEWLGAFMPIAFESFDFSEYDLVVSISSEGAKGIITRPQTMHMCYCLTPTRYLWSGYKFYFRSRLIRIFSKPIVTYLREWDKVAAERPDIMIAISDEVRKRIKRYYNRETSVIYPPVKVGKSKLLTSEPENREYYLIVSRLVPYKKVGIAIAAFNELGFPLVVVGTGSEKRKLERISGKNIHFEGFVAEEKLESLYRGAKVLIFPQKEDFGITAVEAQVCGVPVIAYRAGGALETVTDQKTGIFFERQSKDSLVDAVKKFEALLYSKETKFKESDLIDSANRFSEENFKEKFKKVFKNLNLAKV